MNVEIRKDSVGAVRAAAGRRQRVPSIDTKNVIDADRRQQRRHRGDRRHLRRTITSDIDKVPFLGDVPIVGYLFKQTRAHEPERPSC